MKRRPLPQAGFTLIELITVTAVIALVSALVLANYNGFGGRVLLQNFAYDIALSIRQAQQYGISVQSFQGGYNAPYGIHFQPSSGGSVFLLFADAVDENGYYDSGELVQSTSLSQGYTISDLCVTPPSQSEICGLTSLDIVFQRPDPDAFIRTQDLAGLNESARIVISSPRGDTKDVTVEINGQIAVN